MKTSFQDYIQIFQNLIQSLINVKFPHCLKQAKVIPAFKKEEKLDKSNYRPVSILPVISKIYERLMYDRMYKYFDQIFPKFQCGFRKRFGTQNCLLIAKLQAFGFDNDSLNFICNYLVGREQRVKINLSFSTWSKIENDLPQGSLLGPSLLNINTLDMFFEQKDVNFAAYTDDNTPYFCDKTLEVLLSKIQICALKLSEWF